MCFIIPNALPMYVTQFSRVQGTPCEPLDLLFMFKVKYKPYNILLPTFYKRVC
jgi:hypothetical protein